MKVVVIGLFILSTLGVLFLVFQGRSPEVPEAGGNAEVAKPVEELVVSRWGMVSRFNTSIEELMELYREWSGEEVVGDPEILKRKIHFVMRGPFTPTEGVRFLEMTLKLNGYEISKNVGELSITEVPFQLTGEQKIEARMKPYLKNEFSEEPFIKEGESMSYPSVTGLEVAQLFEGRSGKRVIQAMSTANSDFSFTAVGPANNGEVATRIWKSLNEAGYGFIEVPGYENLLWLVVANETKVAEARKNKGRPNRRTRYVPRPRE